MFWRLYHRHFGTTRNEVLRAEVMYLRDLVETQHLELLHKLGKAKRENELLTEKLSQRERLLADVLRSEPTPVLALDLEVSP